MTDQSPPAMDYEEHERTYEGFIKLTKIGTVTCLTLMIALILFAFGGSWGTFLGSISVIALLVGLTVGTFSSGDGMIAVIVPFVLSFLFMLISVT